MNYYNGNASTLTMPIVIAGDIGSACIKCNIIIGGVTFDDLTTAKVLMQQNLDKFGCASLVFIKPLSAHSNCHKFQITDGAAIIASFN